MVDFCWTFAAPGAHRATDAGCNASKAPTTIGGKAVYSAYFEGGMGYRNDKTTGIATGDEPESMYAVMAGKHYNKGSPPLRSIMRDLIALSLKS